MKKFLQPNRGSNSVRSGSRLLLAAAVCALGLGSHAWGQAEPEAFGTLRGIRVNGELMAFTTGVRAMPVGGPGGFAGGGFGGGAQAERLSGPQYTLDGILHPASIETFLNV
jgi:hypothetical protein